jgi:hypothetical protein
LFHFDIGEGRLGTDESTFNSIICTRSWAHLRHVMTLYLANYGHSLEKAIASEFSGNAEKVLLGIRKSQCFLSVNWLSHINNITYVMQYNVPKTDKDTSLSDSTIP